MSNQKLIKNIKKVMTIEILNQAHDDGIKRFGFVNAQFLFWLPKYSKWYDSRIKELKLEVKK